MIINIILWSIRQRGLVVLATLGVILAGWFVVNRAPVDAIPDLSDVQVIVKTSFAGQSPTVIEDQVTYPISNAMLSVPGAKVVRGFSFFGDSYVYIIFDETTDIYWARSRVLEVLSQVRGTLPSGAIPALGPDATGVGWVYLYALVDESGKRDAAELRRLQDWFVKLELQTVKGVAEVASVGGMVKQYEVQLSPERLTAFNITPQMATQAVRNGNGETGASVIQLAEAEYMINVDGYIQNIVDLEDIPLQTSEQGSVVYLKDVATIRIKPAPRRGVTDFNGKGEAPGGIIVMRYGENAIDTIKGVKAKLQELQNSLPDGVTIVPVYDRSTLINNTLNNLWSKLKEEMLIVTIVCAAFLFHLRSSLVAVIALPVGMLVAMIAMYWQGITANMMSLGGIAIALGAMTDGAIVMIDNYHKHLALEQNQNKDRWQILAHSCAEVGPAVFFSLLVITVSFLPVFMLEDQEGKLFSPLAYTKTYAMAAAAVISITLTPVILGYSVKALPSYTEKNPLNRLFLALYRPLLRRVLHYPKLSLLAALALSLSALVPLKQLQTEFMPDINEGSLMYMPTTYTGVSISEARDILQLTDKLIMTIPEVKTVFGKIGRAETATDPAPLTMIETFIELVPQSDWRDGMTIERLKAELEQTVSLPGLTNAWVMPIKTRIDMLTTGIKTPLGIKVSGSDLTLITDYSLEIEALLNSLPETISAYAERAATGRYINIHIKRENSAQYGLNVDDIQQHIKLAVGGMRVSEAVEGRERYGISLRFGQTYRDTPEQLAKLPISAPTGAQIVLGDVADISVTTGPAGIKSENARQANWIYIDSGNADITQYISAANDLFQSSLSLPPGLTIEWVGQYESIARAKKSLSYIIPITIVLIGLLIYLSFKKITEVLIVLGTLPLALVGGIWLISLLQFKVSVAVIVGFIALAGVAIEIGVLMLVYLNQGYDALKSRNQHQSLTHLIDMTQHAASQRLRPILMTTTTVIAGLLPLLFAQGAGAEVMQRIAAPMVGGMLSALLLSLLVLPALYIIWRQASRQPTTTMSG